MEVWPGSSRSRQTSVRWAAVVRGVLVAIAALLCTACSNQLTTVLCRDVTWSADTGPWRLRLDERNASGYLEVDVVVPEGETTRVILRPGVLHSTDQMYELTLRGEPGVGANAFRYDWVFRIDRRTGEGTLETRLGIDALTCEVHER